MKNKEEHYNNYIYLSKNYGYKWFVSGDFYVKGYFFYKDILYKDLTAVQLLENVNTFNEFNDFAKELNGSYAIICRKNNELWACVDRARSIPLFFSKKGISISDNADKLREVIDIQKEDVNTRAIASLLSAGYLMFNNTVYNDILQLDLGQVLRLNDSGYQLKYYYRHISDIKKISREDAKKEFRKVLNDVFDRVIKVLDNRPIVLSLSGGYDSRYVACMLKEKGIENVLCYTYGKKDSPDVLKSKDIAQKLGYKWYFVEHTNELIRSIVDKDFFDYLSMSNTHDYITYIQNYVAVREMHKCNIIQPNSVFLTGLCGDMPSGNYIMNLDDYKNVKLNADYMAESLFTSINHRYDLEEQVKKEVTSEMKQNILSIKKEYKNLQEYVSVKDCIETGSGHSRCFLGMNSVHEFFGYEYVLPLWDNKFLDFWYSMPMDYRIKQNLYEDYIMNDLANLYQISYLKIRPKTLSWDIKKKQLKTKLKYFCGSILARFMYSTGIPIIRKYDINNYGVLAAILYKEIKYKGIINYKKANQSLIITLFVIERRYGSEVLKKVKKLIKER